MTRTTTLDPPPTPTSITLLITLTLVFSHPAAAQHPSSPTDAGPEQSSTPAPTPPDEAPEQATPPALSDLVDVVHLSDGSIVRCAILQIAADGSVTFVDYQGQIRTVPPAQVVYAGAAAAAPGSSPSPDSTPTSLTVEFDANVPVIIARRTASTYAAASGWSSADGPFTAASVAHEYERICQTPCSAELAPGDLTVAASLNRRYPVEARDVLRLSSNAQVEVEYTDRRRPRVIGAVIATVGVATGLAMSSAGFARSSRDQCESIPSPVSCQRAADLSLAGLFTATGSALGYLTLAINDRVTFEVTER